MLKIKKSKFSLVYVVNFLKMIPMSFPNENNHKADLKYWTPWLGNKEHFSLYIT